MPDRPLRILHVNTSDLGGGAEQVGRQLFEAERASGYDSWLAVGTRRGSNPNVLKIPRLPLAYPGRRIRLVRRLYRRLEPYAGRIYGVEPLRQALLALQDWPEVERKLGREDFAYPGSHRLLDLPPQPPDLIHGHNLHGDYFDLRRLPQLSHARPLILTLHDQWILTGHCGYSFNCERWNTGCGHCPDLTIYPAIEADATDFNWRRKRKIYARSRLYVATPTRWLMTQVEQSMLAAGVREARVIPLGINTATFHPGDKFAARAELGIPREAKVVMFTANYVRGNPRKDFATIKAAVIQLAEQHSDQCILFVALGENAPERIVERVGQSEIWIEPFTPDPAVVARYQQAADVYAHAARADNQPLTVLEALACGTPVVAAKVGGVPELIDDGQNGLLVDAGDAAAMARQIDQILQDADLRARLGGQAAATAQRRYDLQQTLARYLEWYAVLTENNL